jgi:tRNA-splicing ligase RtcB
LDLNREKAFLEKKHILHSIFQRSDLDEAPGAYKNIKTVMSQQSDLVEPMIELRPLGVIKG